MTEHTPATKVAQNLWQEFTAATDHLTYGAFVEARQTVLDRIQIAKDAEREANFAGEQAQNQRLLMGPSSPSTISAYRAYEDAASRAIATDAAALAAKQLFSQLFGFTPKPIHYQQ